METLGLRQTAQLQQRLGAIKDLDSVDSSKLDVNQMGSGQAIDHSVKGYSS